MLGKLSLHLLEGEVAAVNPPLSLPQQSVHSLDRVDVGVGIWKIGHFEASFVDPHAENSIFSQVDVLVIQHRFV